MEVISSFQTRAATELLKGQLLKADDQMIFRFVQDIRHTGSVAYRTRNINSGDAIFPKLSPVEHCKLPFSICSTYFVEPAMVSAR